MSSVALDADTVGCYCLEDVGTGEGEVSGQQSEAEQLMTITLTAGFGVLQTWHPTFLACLEGPW